MKMTWKDIRVVGILFVFFLSSCSHQQDVLKMKKTSKIIKEEYHIPQEDETLYVLHKNVPTQKQYTSDEIILFLEPFSVPTAAAFDVPNYSWMDAYAKKGYDTWAMDFRGFGQSSRPKEMSEAPHLHKPVVHVHDATKDVETVVNWIKQKRNVNKIHLVGWSYGGVVAGNYAITHPQDVNTLVLYGYMHGFTLPIMTEPFDNPLQKGEFNPHAPSYQTVEFDTGMHHWHMMRGEKKIVTNEATGAVKQVFLHADPLSRENNGSIRRPMGPLEDLYSIWNNRPLYDISQIISPVLVIYGEDDWFAEKDMRSKLTGAKRKKEVVIPHATHWAVYEKNHDVLFKEVLNFIEMKEGMKE
ncbi:alpha/beta hydrolase [Bacillus cereus]|uniref:Alpha/beta hydrolase n=1 Tax=Bacillus cereus TaxID=1396 RepID=A0AAW5L5J9_BACCE|nr:alpha/beta hydrolase [Bacillus cereus]MCQ6288165.1 alpha/beta hydrolase [Bacillus cereus]MCQ6306970.1 alpha/beta hydrolase [Bacillus cereus]MCQ6317249.1 alpha/beta hydrolase [Bacillus cereus]MCQ6328029.1 alpha/beta hydrolase [Bacillus cereus]MCQ6385386.1 alpha/beta hydrolase [Bacillus cereus]